MPHQVTQKPLTILNEKKIRDVILSNRSEAQIIAFEEIVDNAVRGYAAVHTYLQDNPNADPHHLAKIFLKQQKNKKEEQLTHVITKGEHQVIDLRDVLERLLTGYFAYKMNEIKKENNYYQYN